MVNRIYPVDAIGGAPAYSGRALRQTQAPFLAGALAGRPLGARSGVRPGTSPTTVTATTTTWSCGPHAGVLDVQAAAEAGPYTFAIDAAVTGAMTAANASNPRIDIIYDQMTDTAEDGTGNVAATVSPKYLAGTAAAVPTAPAAPARSIVLARINVPRSGAGNPSVTWVAPHAVGAGGMLPVWDQAERDALTKSEPLLIWRLDKHWAEIWNGSGWEAIGRHAERNPRLSINTNGNTGGDANLGQVIVGRSPQAQRVMVEIAGTISPSSQGDAGLDLVVSAGTVVQNPQVRIFTSIGAQWYGYARRAYVDVAANTDCTISVFSRSSVVANYQVTVDFEILAAGQY